MQLECKQAVKRIDVDLMTNGDVVEYDHSLISMQEIKKRLENSGYDSRAFTPTL